MSRGMETRSQLRHPSFPILRGAWRRKCQRINLQSFASPGLIVATSAVIVATRASMLAAQRQNRMASLNCMVGARGVSLPTASSSASTLMPELRSLGSLSRITTRAGRGLDMQHTVDATPGKGRGKGTGKGRGVGKGHGKGATRLTAAVHRVEDLAQSLGKGRSVKDVTLDPNMAEAAAEVSRALADCGRQLGPNTELLVRASAAFSRVRVIHSELLNAISNLPEETWLALPPASLVNAVVSSAWLPVEDTRLRARWSAALAGGAIARLSIKQFVDLVWAVASLDMADPGGLGSELISKASRCELRGLGWPQLGKLAWGLARLTSDPAADITSVWVQRILDAAQRQRSPAGPHIGKIMLAFANVGRSAYVWDLFGQAKGTLSRDAYAVLLRDANRTRQAEIFQHMASACSSIGLKAMVLNAAIIRLIEDGDNRRASEIMAEMSTQKLWTPVTYILAQRLGGEAAHIEGQPSLPGLLDPGAGSHKYVRAAFHALGRAQPGDLGGVIAGLEEYSRSKSWLKFGAADEKGAVIDGALREFVKDREKLGYIVEFGTFLGYSSLRMVRTVGKKARIVTMETDPEVACLASNLIEYAGAASQIDVRIGDCEDLAPRLAQELGPRSVDVVYMDHNQMIYHDDVARLELLGVLGDGARLVATQGLKPGAPLLLWRLVEAERAGRCELEVVSSPDCGCPMMEDWVIVAKLFASNMPWTPAEPPRALALLAAECGLMRWRTAQGLVSEKTWNSFVQHVRKELEHLIDVSSARHVWPDPEVMARARQLQHNRMDY